VLVVHHVFRPDDSRQVLEVGAMHPLHSSALGKVLSAFDPVAHGEAVELPAEQRRELNAQTDPTWPHVHARLRCSYDEFLQIFPCNHIHATPGDRVLRLVQAAEIAGIPSVVLGESPNRLPLWERLE
jgi:L-fucose isomerase